MDPSLASRPILASIEPLKVQRPLAGVMAVGLVSLITAAIVKADGSNVLNPGTGLAVAGENAGSDGNIRQLANNLYGDHVYAFELTSVLLVVAVARTVVLTRKWPKGAVSSGDSPSGSDDSRAGSS